jgi:hypothetical protein
VISLRLGTVKAHFEHVLISCFTYDPDGSSIMLISPRAILLQSSQSLMERQRQRQISGLLVSTKETIDRFVVGQHRKALPGSMRLRPVIQQLNATDWPQLLLSLDEISATKIKCFEDGFNRRTSTHRHLRCDLNPAAKQNTFPLRPARTRRLARGLKSTSMSNVGSQCQFLPSGTDM